ncbi:response regulator transcription factor [Asanoa sp. WMMD1127]|uniref:LuxR C-terminal-related transcriptional regulator n=1 Tax=Asanoa sp. WMMD1127 TaxID=3016107 RepID=UPI0024164E41|nr:response regulator transcription factor [Asanoa sp. WMMD1127]MDG4825534.1 response regulator transcription factor [Asanoa sp. WMMD1127]
MRVVIGEDQALLRDGLTRILTAYGETVVAAVATAPELRAALADVPADVAIVDVRLPPSFTDEGLRVATQARARIPGFPILVLSQHVEVLYARELLSDGRGGLGYLLKDRVADVARFVEAMRIVAAGGTVLDPDVVADLLTRRGHESIGRLTPREREVLRLMAEGRTNAGIANRLGVTEKAVNKHINNIFAKLGLLPDHNDNRRVLAVLNYLEAP